MIISSALANESRLPGSWHVYAFAFPSSALTSKSNCPSTLWSIMKLLLTHPSMTSDPLEIIYLPSAITSGHELFRLDRQLSGTFSSVPHDIGIHRSLAISATFLGVVMRRASRSEKTILMSSNRGVQTVGANESQIWSCLWVNERWQITWS